jgi:eukaryotic-like serine/threonine-protein kinase
VGVFICQGCGSEYAAWPGRCPSCGNTESIRLNQPSDKMVGKVIRAKYKIERKLGQGGMGAVYLAEQVGIGHRVALKFLKSEFSQDPELARRFLNEAKSYARVAHPNAVTLHDFGQDDDGNLFIAMEYAEGVDLKRTLAENGRLKVSEAIDLALQVADVLANAHSKGVIHRDLKPENIMIRRGMRGLHAKVLDFGIARLIDGGTKLTVVGAIAGTPRYMSPEQVAGQEVDHRADIYSLGIVLYEALTGRQPFDGQTVSEILRKQTLDPMPLLAQYAPDRDMPDVDKVIQKACAKQRQDRWDDLVVFAHALSQAIPTQLQISAPFPLVSPSGLHQVGSASGPPVSPSSPGLDGTAQTFMRTPLPMPMPATPSAPASTQLEPSAGALTQIDPRAQSGVTLPAPSRAPLLIVGGLVLAALAAVGYLLLREPATVPTTPVASAVDVSVPVVVAPSGLVPVDDAVKTLEEASVRGALANARTEYEQANLDAAESYLKNVLGRGTQEFQNEAKALMAQIGTIRADLKLADSLRGQGRCDEARPLYERVLKTNKAVRAASAGLGYCRAAAIDTTMP